MTNGIYKGLFKALDDPYSEYMTKEEYEALEESMSGEFEGIGVVVSPVNDYIRVVSPIDGTLRQRAGIKAGDIILAVDGRILMRIDFRKPLKDAGAERYNSDYYRSPRRRGKNQRL